MDRIRCSLCSTPFPVSEEDPDAAVDDAVQHVARVHGRDPLLGMRGLLSLERRPESHDSGSESPHSEANGSADAADSAR